MNIIQIATFFWLIAWILLIAWTFVLIAERFFHDGGQDWKSHLSTPQGPRGRVEAGERRVFFLGWYFFGRRPKKYSAKKKTRLSPASAQPLGPCGVLRCDFQSCPPSWKRRSATQHGSPSYSAKSTLLSQNNVAIRMIATFMPKPSSIFNLLFLICLIFLFIIFIVKKSSECNLIFGWLVTNIIQSCHVRFIQYTTRATWIINT